MPGRLGSPIVSLIAHPLLLALVVVATTLGCGASRQGAAGEDAPVPSPASEFEDGDVRDTTVSNPIGGRREGFDLGTVYFDFDMSTIDPDAQRTLATIGTELRRSGATVLIEGHCDATGSDEYNIALGERRAEAVRQFLYNSGVPDRQMDTVSFGEARPAVAGSGEAVWRLNRRAEILVD